MPARNTITIRKGWTFSVLILCLLFPMMGLREVSHGQVLPAPKPFERLLSRHVFASPPTTAHCLNQFRVPCYSPLQLQTAYDTEPLFNAGVNGKGRTIAIVDAFGSPTVRRDLKHFDADFSLPPPPSLRIIQPVGKVAPYDPNAQDRTGWAFETSLDVEYAHALAPGANILLIETPVDETIGTPGFKQIVKAENLVINHHLADVISQSFGAPEETFPSKRSLLDLRGAYKNARAKEVSVLASSGDNGPTGASDLRGNFYLRRVVSWPASDPLVTGVGGTKLFLTNTGQRRQTDAAWTEPALGESPIGGGGGTSSLFAQPSYQQTVTKVVGAHRGVPDVSLSAASDAGVLVYTSFRLSDPLAQPGYHLVGGTSEAAPLMAGLVADADQAAGKSLGLLNPSLYRLGSGSPAVPDVSQGDTTVHFPQGGKEYTVKGYKAVKGYDLATGLGTVDAAKLISALTGQSF